MMEDAERMVLRRRKQYLSEEVQASDELLKDLSNMEVLTDDMVNRIQLEKTNQTKMYRLIEAIVASKPEEGFSKFCLALDKSYRWLSKDLRGDLRVERGEVVPQLETIQEAAVLVHRKFGTSKRFSEGDKKEMAEMIAIKLQIAQDEWQKEMDRLKLELEETKKELKVKDDMAVKVNNVQRDFVRRHETQLVTHAHDLTTTRQIIQRILEDPVNGGALFIFKENQDRFLKQMALVLNHRDALYHEREKCLKMLGVKNKKIQLDEVISQATGLRINANMEAEDKDEIIKRLNKEVVELESQIDAYEDGIVEFKNQLGERDREISKLRHMVQI